MPAKQRQRAIPLALVALGAALLAAPAANAADARYEGISADGSVAFFSTTDKLVPGDTDSKTDVYERSFDAAVESYVTREVSIGPSGGNNAYDAQFLATVAAGDKVFFETAGRLTPADTDHASDVYVRDLATNTTRLVSAGDPSCAGSGCGNAEIGASAVQGGIVDAGNEVFFISVEQLSSQDTDSSADLYVRDIEAGTTTLVSAAGSSCTGSCGAGPSPVVFQGASADGSKAIFTTVESLLGEDEDAETDLYLRNLDTGETRLVSTPGAGIEPCPSAGNCAPSARSAISPNGAHVFFETSERISAEDTDESQDVYDWSGGTATLASTGEGEGGNGPHHALFADSSASGSEVFFETDEQLAGSDGDGERDVYVRTGGETELVSEGDGSCTGSACDRPAELKWVSSDGTTAVLSTAEPLLAEDGDELLDVYLRTLPGGPTKLASLPDPSCAEPECGEGANASFAHAAAGGARVFFVGNESLTAADTDTSTDVYERDLEASSTALVSAGSINGNGEFDAQLRGVSQDGSNAFFVTRERLTGEDDFLGEEDVYSRSGGNTLLVSQGNDAELESLLAPPAPLLERTDPESPAASTEPRVVGSEAEGVEGSAVVKLYETADCSGEPLATGSVEELAEPGIAVTVASGATTTLRATAEAEGFVSSCSASISYTQKDPPSEEEEEGGGGEEEVGGGGGGGGSGGGGGGGSTPGPAPAPAPGSAPAPAKTYGGGIPYVAPSTRITFGPTFRTRARRPVFRFTDSTGQPGTRFVCKVDRRRWKRCGSPTRLKGLGRGKHVFRVKGMNAVGVWEARPSKRAFKLVRGGKHRRAKQGRR